MESINVQNAEITFNLDIAVGVPKGGDVVACKEVRFKKPDLRAAPIFEQVASILNVGMAKSFELLKGITPSEEFEQAQEEAKSKTKTVNTGEQALESLDEMTIESILEEANGVLAMMRTMDVNFEKLYNLFKKLIVSNDSYSTICYLGDVPLKSGTVEKIDYNDFRKMLAVYVTFFGKPVRAGTVSGSSNASESHMEAKEL